METLDKPAAPINKTGLTWWRWSAAFALLIGGLEFVILIGMAVLGEIELAVLGMYFVVAATGIALVVTGVLIFGWRVLTSAVPVLNTNRSWLVLYITLLSFPLYFSPISLYEWALAAPTILGLLLPRFSVPHLRHLAPAPGQFRNSA